MKHKKNFWESRTIWVNFLALVAMVIQQQWGYVVSPELQGLNLIVLNTWLRFDTDSAIQ